MSSKHSKKAQKGPFQLIDMNVIRARKACIYYHGAKCKVCDFDFGDAFGPIGEGFIHVHHLKLISQHDDAYEINPIKDLQPVCPNCHAMLHRRSPPYSIEELREILGRTM